VGVNGIDVNERNRESCNFLNFKAKLLRQTRPLQRYSEKAGDFIRVSTPYSPNLNLIERLWKLVEAEVLAATYFPGSKSFQKAIINFLNQLQKKK
jgi:transposase